MASNQHTGLNPLNIPRVDATQSGINSAFATISREIAERTPRESLSVGSLHTGAGTFSVPPVAIEQVRPRHAFHAIVYMDAADSSTVKANFQAAYVIEQDDTQFPVFATEADQTVAIADGEKYWVKILVNNDYEVQSASFIQAATTTDVDPSPTANGEIYKLCVEFDEDAEGKIVVTYHRFDSINYRKPDTSSSSHPWKATAGGSSSINIAAGNVMGLRAPTIDPVSPVSVPLYAEPVYYVGGSVTVTAATGWIYAVVTVGNEVINIDPYNLGFTQIYTSNRKAGTVSVEFNTASPSANVSGSVNQVWLPICEVALAAGVASVEAQTLTHNPILAIEIADAQ